MQKVFVCHWRIENAALECCANIWYRYCTTVLDESWHGLKCLVNLMVQFVNYHTSYHNINSSFSITMQLYAVTVIPLVEIALRLMNARKPLQFALHCHCFILWKVSHQHGDLEHGLKCWWMQGFTDAIAFNMWSSALFVPTAHWTLTD